MTTRALVLICLALIAPARGQETSVATLVGTLASPLAAERERAVGELARRDDETRAALLIPLRAEGSSPLARRGIARVFATRPVTGTQVELAQALALEADRQVAAALARAISLHEAAGYEAVLAAGIRPSSDRMGLYVREHVGFALERVIAENMESDGSFKGFYDGQFDRLKVLDTFADPVLEALATDESARAILRQAAVRALGASGRKDVGLRLLRVRSIYCHANGLADLDRTPEWRLGRAEVQRYYDDRMLQYLDYALARCDYDRPIIQRIRHHDGEKRDLLALMPLVDADQRTRIRTQAAYEMFSVAYCYQQLRDFDRAREVYLVIGIDYRDTSAAKTAYYNLACMESLRDRVDAALEFLATAIEVGYLDADWIRKDNDLLALRRDARFEDLMQRHGFGVPGPGPR